MTDQISAAQFTAQTLSEALPYIQRYAGKTIVVKYGGHAWWTSACRQSLRATWFC